YRAMWTEGRNMQEFEEIAAVLSTIGLDPTRYSTLVQEQVIKDELKANTEEAVSRGVFGAPTMFVGSEMFFGHDRLAWVEELAGAGDIPPTWTA
ncbi:MAG: DsbA family protein, partial [Alphaproteobacteria bacterium]|nr:DsbA family protein [Alphaproteobacteria bacterium]